MHEWGKPSLTVWRENHKKGPPKSSFFFKHNICLFRDKLTQRLIFEIDEDERLHLAIYDRFRLDRSTWQTLAEKHNVTVSKLRTTYKT